MASLVDSVVLPQVALGIVGGSVTIVLGVFGYYQLTPLAAAAIVLLSLIVAIHGLKPFGDTIGYQVLLSAVWIPFGIAWFVTEGSVLPLLLAAVSVFGALFYARRATEHGIWTPAN